MLIRKTLCAVLLLAAANTTAQAQTYPTRPIRVLIGFSAGSATDAIARLYGQKISDMLGTPIVIDNRPGGSQLLAIRTLQTAAADGYTLFVGVGSSLATGPAVRSDLPYDPLKDFSLLGGLAVSPGAITVHPTVPAQSLRDLINYAKGNPNRLSYASAGFGSSGHFDGEYFMHLTGTKMTHVPYKSDAEAMRELGAGTVQVSFTTVQFVIALAQTGKVRPLAAIASKRLPALPNVPSLAETDIKGLEGLAPYTFYGLVGVTGIPAPVANRLSGAINKAGTMPDVVNRLQEVSYADPMPGTPETFRAFIQTQITKWRELGKNVKLTE
jgi:tripartite-type tricarboxylate transporter receptor subunit TctC